MKRKKIEKHYRIRPELDERIKALQAIYGLPEAQIVERSLEFGLISLARFLAKNKRATVEAYEGENGSPRNQVNISRWEEDIQRTIDIAKTKWFEAD